MFFQINDFELQDGPSSSSSMELDNKKIGEKVTKICSVKEKNEGLVLHESLEFENRNPNHKSYFCIFFNSC